MSVTVPAAHLGDAWPAVHAGEHAVQLAEVAVFGVVRRVERRPRAAKCGSSTTSGTEAHRRRRRCSPDRASRPTRRGVLVANAARKSARISSCTASSFWCSIHCSQPSARHRFAKNCGSIAPTASHSPSRARVDVVAGVATGEEVVARRRDRAGREVLVDVERHERRARRRPPTRRGRRRRPSPPGAPARRGSRSPRACRRRRRRRWSRPAARGRRRRAAGAVEVAADREVVEVVTRPLASTGRPGRSPWSSSRRRRGSTRRTTA